MSLPKISVLALALAAVMTAGCASDRFGGSHQPQPIRPAPIRAAPMGHISQSTLPPPGGYPDAPGNGGDTQMASLGPDAGGGSGMDLTPNNIAGVWKASIGGMNCQVATPMTKFGQGYRTAPLHCPTAFAGVNSWAVSGSQLVFYDSSGGSVATLSSMDGKRFQGQTTSGVPVVLSR